MVTQCISGLLADTHAHLKKFPYEYRQRGLQHKTFPLKLKLKLISRADSVGEVQLLDSGLEGKLSHKLLLRFRT